MWLWISEYGCGRMWLPNVARRSQADNDMRPWQEYPKSYARLAAYIDDKGENSTIYRRFERLAARNILHLESELAQLESKQDKLDEEFVTDKSTIQGATNPGKGKEQAPGNSNKPGQQLRHGFEKQKETGRHQAAVQERLQLANQIRHTLKEYCMKFKRQSREQMTNFLELDEALKHQRDVLALSSPSEQQWKSMQEAFHHPSRGRCNALISIVVQKG